MEDNDEEESGDMMELFASYYGITADEHQAQEGAGPSITEQAVPATIDSPSFNASSYVEDMLENMRAQDLLETDVAFVHDIRSLDSDMQMLVYENYNKFIAATETIKRMKTNVEAMDADMSSVKMKMDLINSRSAALDESLCNKNKAVEKFVRVQRLLKRLEFLTELPERLTGMIDRKEYDAAVQLYRRTNHVLTQYGHVLSFKNIQKSANDMMSSLSSRIMDGLDDPELDSAQVTRFVAILVSVNAPKMRVAEKMLNAHRHRSLRIVKLFSASINNTSATEEKEDALLSATATEPRCVGGSSAVARARQFHQILVVGLIEACKGLTELYGEDAAQRARSSSTASSNGVLPVSVASPLSPSKETQTAPDAAHVATSLTALQSLASSMMAEVSKCLTAVMRQFFSSYNAYVAAHQELLLNNSTKIHTSQMRFYELDDEKQAWIVFAQQAIAEAVFLEKAVNECTVKITKAYPLAITPATASAASKKESVCHAFARAVMAVLNDHVMQSFHRRLQSFQRSFCMACTRDVLPVNSIELLLQGDACSTGPGQSNNPFGDDNTDSSVSTTGGSHNGAFCIDSAARTQLTRLASALPGVLDGLQEDFYSTFADIACDAQQILDVASTLPQELSDLQFVLDGNSSSSANGNATAAGSPKKRSQTGQQALQLPLLYVQKVIAMLFRTSLGASRDVAMRLKDCNDIYCENWPTESAANASAGEEGGQEEGGSVMDTSVSCLLAASLLGGLSTTAAVRLLRELTSQGFTHTATSRTSRSSNHSQDSHQSGGTSGSLPAHNRLRSQLQLLLSNASSSLRLVCIENVSSAASSSLLKALHAMPMPGTPCPESDEADTARRTVSADAIEAANILGKFVSISCAALAESVPSAVSKKLSPTELRPATASKQQLDIERLFAQPVQVFPLPHSSAAEDGLLRSFQLSMHDQQNNSSSRSLSDVAGAGAGPGPRGTSSSSSGASRADDCSVASTVAKALFKNLLETVRQRILSNELYAQISIDVAYLKLVCAALLGTGKGSTEVGVLVDQITFAMRDRYLVV